jgi:hypothetical protein
MNHLALYHRPDPSVEIHSAKPSSAYEQVKDESQGLMVGTKILYPSSIKCIASYQVFSCCDRLAYLLKSYQTFFSYVIEDYRADNSLHSHKILPLTDLSDRELTKNKLVVLLCGLSSSPYTFKKLIDQTEKKDLKEFDVYIPKVVNKGFTSLDEATNPIFLEIKKWACRDGAKELVLVGESNGARIARALDAQLSKPENIHNIKKINIISIAGACQGSYVVNVANMLSLKCLINPFIYSEMSTNSIRTRKLNEDWLVGLENTPEVSRRYYFIAGSHDWLVPNYDSTLFDVPDGLGFYTIFPGHGHLSIVDESAELVSDLIFPNKPYQ